MKRSPKDDSMSAFMKKARIVKWILNGLFVVVAVLFIADVLYINHFNRQEHTAESNSESQTTYLSVDKRKETTGSWVKRDFDLYGETVDLNAQIYDNYVINHSEYEISDWTYTFRAESDCFINQAWNGTVEIHQHVGTADEKVQTLDLMDYNLDDIELDYLNYGDLLIKLDAGDYFIYYTSVADRETPVPAGNCETKVGFILYFLDEPDVSDYTMNYQYHRSYSDCGFFWAATVLGIIWILLLDAYIIALVAYRAALREMELKKTGVSAMSDIYSIIYIIDLKKNELVPVVADKESEKLRPKEQTAQIQLRRLFEWDCKDTYRQTVVDFCDLYTLKERFEGRNTLVCEYNGRHYGWCRLRFFAMDRNPQGELEKVVFTIQVIDEEKQELEDLNKAVKESAENIVEIQQKVVIGLANIIESRDDNTGGHVKRTSEVISVIVDEIQKQGKIDLEGQLAADIVRAAPMHDLGKITIDSAILCKPARLTDEEFAIMKTHAPKSGEMVRLLLDGIEEEHFIQTAFNIARHHHERWDGHGYPDGLKGEEIPLEARIMAVADVYDALVSKRCYKEAMSFEQAYRIMMEGMGTQFDPQMQEIFEACHGKLEDYYRKTR